MASTVILCLVLSFIGSSPVLAQAPQKKPFQQEPGRFRGWGLLRWWPWRGREPEPGGLQWWGDGARGNEREAQPPIIIEPTAGEAVASIIWLHGMGDNGKAFLVSTHRLQPFVAAGVSTRPPLFAVPRGSAIRRAPCRRANSPPRLILASSILIYGIHLSLPLPP